MHHLLLREQLVMKPPRKCLHRLPRSLLHCKSHDRQSSSAFGLDSLCLRSGEGCCSDDEHPGDRLARTGESVHRMLTRHCVVSHQASSADVDVCFGLKCQSLVLSMTTVSSNLPVARLARSARTCQISLSCQLLGCLAACDCILNGPRCINVPNAR